MTPTLIKPDDGSYLVQCRECGTGFWSQVKPTGSKWTNLCPDCLRWHV